MKYPKNYKPYSSMKNEDLKEGEIIEKKIKRITENKEPISDTAPTIYTAREDGVIAGYNIRTDRFDVALSAMDNVNKAKIATRNNRGKTDSEQNQEISSGTETPNIA